MRKQKTKLFKGATDGRSTLGITTEDASQPLQSTAKSAAEKFKDSADLESILLKVPTKRAYKDEEGNIEDISREEAIKLGEEEKVNSVEKVDGKALYYKKKLDRKKRD